MKLRMFIIILVAFLISCNSKVGKYAADANKTNVQESKVIEIFGIESDFHELNILHNLHNAGILKIDSLSVDEGNFNYAIVEFASVKFGLNRGFSFVTSRNDKAAVDSMVYKISLYYGEPWIDNEDKNNPQYQFYGWNTTIPGKPSIRIRPLHSEEGGIVMTWEF